MRYGARRPDQVPAMFDGPTGRRFSDEPAEAVAGAPAEADSAQVAAGEVTTENEAGILLV